MKTNFSMLFYLKKQKNYTSGLAPVYLRITVDGERAEVTTNRECEPEKWNSHSGRATGTCLGLSNINKAMKRETKIKQVHPNGLLYYLWFIGVDLSNQNKGIGSKLLQDVISEGQKQNRTICLETSTLKNVPWYEKFGFSIYCSTH